MELEREHGNKERGDEAKEEARSLLENMHSNNEGNQEMAQQERLQLQQKERRQELRLVAKMGMVRRAAEDLEARRIQPH